MAASAPPRWTQVPKLPDTVRSFWLDRIRPPRPPRFYTGGLGDTRPGVYERLEGGMLPFRRDRSVRHGDHADRAPREAGAESGSPRCSGGGTGRRSPDRCSRDLGGRGCRTPDRGGLPSRHPTGGRRGRGRNNQRGRHRASLGEDPRRPGSRPRGSAPRHGERSCACLSHPARGGRCAPPRDHRGAARIDVGGSPGGRSSTWPPAGSGRRSPWRLAPS